MDEPAGEPPPVEPSSDEESVIEAAIPRVRHRRSLAESRNKVPANEQVGEDDNGGVEETKEGVSEDDASIGIPLAL